MDFEKFDLMSSLSPTIDIMYGLPSDVYQLDRLRRLIFYMDYPP